jgi:hypothetical protein
MVIMPDQYGEPIADSWTYQWLPGNLMYPSYLAGRKESRFQSVMAHDENDGYIWDIALGGRVGLFRYGTTDCRPDGWQLDMEGAAFPRLDLDHREDLMATDFRFGLPLSYGEGPWRTKFAFYHLSSHVGDEYMRSHQSLDRVNYSRNALVWGNTYYLNDDTRAYLEVEWASDCDVGEPWAYQLGVDYSPSGLDGRLSAPFAALNEAGWQWRAHPFGRLLRVGAEYYDGKNDQFEFYDRNEQKVGFGVWYDY